MTTADGKANFVFSCGKRVEKKLTPTFQRLEELNNLQVSPGSSARARVISRRIATGPSLLLIQNKLFVPLQNFFGFFNCSGFGDHRMKEVYQMCTNTNEVKPNERSANKSFLTPRGLPMYFGSISHVEV